MYYRADTSTLSHSSERQSDGEVEREVAAEVRMNDGIMLFVILVSRVDGFHSHIEAQDEIIEVQPQTETIGQCYLLIEILKLKLATGLISVSAQGPDVSRVDECSAVELPKQMRPHLSIEIEFHVTGLVYEVDASVVAPERSRPQLSYVFRANSLKTIR